MSIQLLFSRQNYSNLKHFQLHLGRILIFFKIIFEDRKIFSPSIQIYKNVKMMESEFSSYGVTLQVNYVKRSSFDFVTHLEFSSLALQI